MKAVRDIINQVISFILPVTVLVIIPLYVERDLDIKHIWVFVIGLIIISVGLAVMVMTISLFARIGKGTLAPWSPPKKLVTVGIYGHVRNPMILGVLTVLIGESIALMSITIGLWTLIFFFSNNLYFRLSEEPDLKKRFGDMYTEYKKNVPRWIPRLKKDL